MPSLPVHESARASSKVSRSGLGGRSTGSPCTKRRKVCKVDRLVAGVLDHRHLLGEVVEVDPVGRVRRVREVALRPDAVVEEHGNGRAVGRQRRPHLFLLGGEHDLGSGLRRARRALVARAPACGHEQAMPQAKATSGIADTFIRGPL